MSETHTTGFQLVFEGIHIIIEGDEELMDLPEFRNDETAKPSLQRPADSSSDNNG